MIAKTGGDVLITIIIDLCGQDLAVQAGSLMGHSFPSRTLVRYWISVARSTSDILLWVPTS